MDLTLRAAESMLIMVSLFAAALALRGTGVLTEAHSAIVGGFLWSGLGLPTGGNLFLNVLFGVCKQLEGGLVPLVGLAVGLMLRPLPVLSLAPLILFVAAAQLVLQPLYLAQGADLVGLSAPARGSLLVQGAAPVATLPAIFAREHGCDGSLAAALVLSTTLLAIGTIPLMILWLH